MRFTANSSLPPNLHVQTRADLDRAMELMRADIAQGSLVGFDTETSGLEADGLGVVCHYVCLATTGIRTAIATSGPSAHLMEPLAAFLLETQHLHCGFNIIYDWNVLYGYTKYQLKWETPLELSTCYADGMTLFCRFDEEGEETYGGRGLKDRARYYLGIPMASFDWILKSGGIDVAMKLDPRRALDYCTRDGWVHLSLIVVGERIAKQMPWAYRCPCCKDYMFTPSKVEPDKYVCTECGPQDTTLPTTVMDWHRELDVPFLAVLHNMQKRGLVVDWDYLAELEPHVARAQETALHEFHRQVHTGLEAKGIKGRVVNPGSSPQLRGLYFDKANEGEGGFGLPSLKKTKTGDPSTDADTLDKLLVQYNPPGLQKLLEYRDLKKILATYIIGLREQMLEYTGKVHGNFRPITKTGRLASKNPNLQNLPAAALNVELQPSIIIPELSELLEMGYDQSSASKLIAERVQDAESEITEYEVSVRKAVVAPQGWKLLCADYAQLEVRLTAIESNDKALIDVINQGTDMHCYTASRAFTSVFPYLDYDLMNEAKTFLDGETEARFETVRKAAQEPEYLDKMLSGRLGSLGHADKALFSDLVGSSLSADSWDGWMEGLEGQGELVAKWLGKDDRRLKGLRSSAKSAIFGIIYGIGPVGLAVQITKATGEVCDPKFARDLINAIKNDVFPGIGVMLKRFESALYQFGYVRTRMGRYRHPAAAHSGDSALRARARRQSMNSPIQGLAADVVQRAMIAVEWDPRLMKMQNELLLQVHDELLSQAPGDIAEEALVIKKDLMRYAHRMETPVLLDVSGSCADTWMDAK